VRSELLRDLSRQATLLMRAVDYVTGKALDLPPDILVFAEGDGGEEASFIMEESPDYPALVAGRRHMRFAAYKSILQGAVAARDEAIDANGWNIGVPISFQAHISDNFGTAEVQKRKRLFIRDLNRLVTDAIRSGRSSTRMPLPFEPAVIAATENAVLAGIGVSGLTFIEGRSPNSEFILTIEHPRCGTLFRGGEGKVWSDAAPARATSNDLQPWRWPISLPNGVSPAPTANLFVNESLWHVTQFVLPLFAPYSLFVEVPNPGEWSEAPEVESIRIDFVVMRPH